ncbi:MAG: HEAT repeat domain-containing protein [Planctomycetota bacterium]|nr:HEAT repeat domain-containing protein [Planctomycetaceae bacterium]MDQ3331966.1 HEAT repeat domain-containing protein [Planctomycetota bacterium]
MSADPLHRTFDTLAASSRSEADDVLIAALESTRPELRDLAAVSICRRGSVRGIVELLRRFDGLSDAARRQLLDPSEPASRAFRQCLRQKDEFLTLHSLTAVRLGELIEHLPAVSDLLRSESGEVRREAFETFSVVADRLYEALSHPAAGTRSGRIDVGRVRDETLDSLAALCSRLEVLSDPESVLEHLLALGTPRHPAIVKVTRHETTECRQLVETVLATSRHPGVMRLLFEFLSEPYPPRKAFEALRHRDDSEFISALLRWFPEEPTAAQLANFRQIDSVAWLTSPERIAAVPEPLQGRLPAFILATGLPEARKMELQEWVVRNGSAEGRRSATQVFDRLDFETTRRILLDSLDSDDDDISAWATTQLRPRHVPGAFRMLIDRLDSGSDVVRQAAREQLQGFTIEHLVAIHERLTPTMCFQAGQLVRKIDPDCASKLAAVLAGPVQRQRIATTQAIGRLGLVAEMREPLLQMLHDDDSAVRRVAVEVLSDDQSPEVMRALEDLRADSSPRVRQAVERSLDGSGILMRSSDAITAT